MHAYPRFIKDLSGVKLKRKRITHLGILAEHIVLNLLFKMVFYEHLTHAAKSKDFMLMGEFN